MAGSRSLETRPRDACEHSWVVSKEACGAESRSGPDEVETCLPVTCWQLEHYNWIIFSDCKSGVISCMYTTGTTIFYHMAVHNFLKQISMFVLINV